MKKTAKSLSTGRLSGFTGGEMQNILATMVRSSVVGPLLVCSLAFTTFSPSVKADTYNYAGNTMLSCTGTLPCTAITGSFTISGPAAPLISLGSFTSQGPAPVDVAADISSFSFTDGVTTLANTTSGIVSSFQVITDASAALLYWDISLSDGNVSYLIENAKAAGDQVQLGPNGVNGVASNLGSPGIVTPGQFTLSTAPVTAPEPSSLSLLAIGLVGGGLLLSRRRTITA